MPEPKKDGPSAHARLDRLNRWVAVLHQRVERLEQAAGIPPLVPDTELIDELSRQVKHDEITS